MFLSKVGHIFRTSCKSQFLLCKIKNLFRKTVGRPITKIWIKKKVNREASTLCPQITNPSIYDSWREPHTEFCKLNFEGRSHRWKFFSLIKELEVMKGLGNLEVGLFDYSDKYLLIPNVSYSQLNVVWFLFANSNSINIYHCMYLSLSQLGLIILQSKTSTSTVLEV